MWVLGARLVSGFSEEAAQAGWHVESVDDDDHAMFVRDHADDIVVGLGIDLTPRDWGLSLNPTLGVRHVIVSDLLGAFFGRGRSRAAAGASLADLMHQAGKGSGLMWTIESVDEIPTVVRQVLSDIHIYGEPFFAQYTSLVDLIASLERQEGKLHVHHAQLSVAYAVSEQFAKARSELQLLERMAVDQSEFQANQNRQFVAAFMGHYSVN